ncbi:hypothetical protein C0Q70_11149 [Pomacea canaliculata]|uniref:Tyrosine-protein phosphatase domain-containing protein n=1 Tax=Pomacea canaliculata TaxID=400727 RepID=A0A2T7P570_POMCA|nr:hypothetical protein C0Q70_11149 [Pomacea canaliculata]
MNKSRINCEKARRTAWNLQLQRRLPPPPSPAPLAPPFKPAPAATAPPLQTALLQQSAPLLQRAPQQATSLLQTDSLQIALLQAVQVQLQPVPLQVAPLLQAVPLPQSAPIQAAPLLQSAPLQAAPLLQAVPLPQTAPLQTAPLLQTAIQAAPMLHISTLQAAPLQAAPMLRTAPLQAAPLAPQLKAPLRPRRHRRRRQNQTLKTTIVCFILLEVIADRGGIIAAVVILVIAIIIAVALFVVFWKRRNQQWCKARTRYRSTKLPRKRMKMKYFAQYLALLHKDSGLLFQEQFEELQKNSPRTYSFDAALADENKIKNRYVNIVPYDHTRVKLTVDSEVGGSDFINASYVPRKVDKYWPDEANSPERFGDITVELTSVTTCRNYTIRHFKISEDTQEERMVLQFFIPGWEDHGANLSPDDFLGFIQAVRLEARTREGPITVHCRYLFLLSPLKQYIFIHDVLKIIIDRKMKTLAGSNGVHDDSSAVVNLAFDPDDEADGEAAELCSTKATSL